MKFGQSSVRHGHGTDDSIFMNITQIWGYNLNYIDITIDVDCGEN